MYVTLLDSAESQRVPDDCIARSSILQQALEADPNGCIRLPCNTATWTDWRTIKKDSMHPLAVARVRS